MIDCNRFVRISDLEEAEKIIEDNEWMQKYPHKTSLGNHWKRPEALLKWVFALVNFGIGTKGKRIVDLGANNGCVPHVVADWGNESYALDYLPSDFEQVKSSCEIVIEDAYVWLAEEEEESFDVVFDICATHLFDTTHDDEIGNYGLLKIGKAVHRVLKTGGKFIVSSDVGDLNYGMFTDANTFIDLIERSGLRLTTPFDDTVNSNTFYNNEYKVVSLVFEKP
jgi:SAM-dependent methyltransferase